MSLSLVLPESQKQERVLLLIQRTPVYIYPPRYTAIITPMYALSIALSIALPSQRHVVGDSSQGVK